MHWGKFSKSVFEISMNTKGLIITGVIQPVTFSKFKPLQKSFYIKSNSEIADVVSEYVSKRTFRPCALKQWRHKEAAYTIIIIIYLWVCLFHAILYPNENLLNPTSVEGKKYVDFSLFVLFFLVVIMMEIILGHFCNFASAVEHTRSIFMNCLLILPCSKFMFLMQQFNHSERNKALSFLRL